MSKEVVIITGAGRGIGRATALRFARSGSQIIAASRSLTELEETRRLVEAAGGTCRVRVTDVASPDDVAALIEDVMQRERRVDVLVNNAGVAPQATMENLDPSQFQMLYAVNMAGLFHTSRSVWGVMKRQARGVIINISSIAALDPFPGFAAYGASKAWVNAWTKGLAEEGRSCGIRVFAVAPGAVETRMLRDAFPDFPKEQTLQPEDVADVVFALAQPECKSASGQTVYVKR